MNVNLNNRPRRLPRRVAAAIARVLEHLWDDESRDFVGRPRHEQANHIFTELLRIRQWLEDDRTLDRSDTHDD